MKFKSVWIAFVLMLFLAACAAEENQPAASERETDEKIERVSDIAATEEATTAQSNVSFSVTPNDGEGTILVSIDRVTLAENMLDARLSLDTINPDVGVCIGQGEQMREYCYPDYAFADWDTGELIEGAYLIAVEMTVTNLDASTTHYVDDEPLPLGATPAPDSEEKTYVFRIDRLRLYDMTRREEPVQGSFVCFSGYGQREEASAAFYLPEGETVTMTVYYIIGENNGNTLSSLALSPDNYIDQIPDTIYPLAIDEGA